jgi:hypothetical protein
MAAPQADAMQEHCHVILVSKIVGGAPPSLSPVCLEQLFTEEVKKLVLAAASVLILGASLA